MRNTPSKHNNRRAGALLRLVLYFMSALCVLGIAAFFALQTRPVRDEVKRFVSETIEKNTGARCRIEDLSGNLLAGFQIKGLKLTDPKTGLPLMSANRIDVSYSAPMLLAKVLWINHIELDGAAVDLVRSPDGKWNLELPDRQKTAKKSRSTGFNIVIRKIDVQNSLVSISQPGNSGKIVRHFTGLKCLASLRIGADISWRINHLAFKLDHPNLELTDAGGYFSYSPEAGVFDFSGIKIKTRKSFLTIDGQSDFSGNRPQLNIQAGVKALSLSEMGRALSIVNMKGEGIISGDLQIKGTPEKLSHHLTLNMGKSRVESRGVITIDGEGMGCDIIAGLSGLNPAAVPIEALQALAGEINADISIKGQRLNLPDRTVRLSIAMMASRIRGYPVDRADMKADINGNDLTMEALQLETPFGDFTGSGSLAGLLSGKKAKQIRLDAKIKGFNPQVFTSDSGFSAKTDAKKNNRLACSLSVTGTIDPAWEQADIKATLNSEQIRFEQVGADSLIATANWRGGMKDFTVSGQCGLKGLEVNATKLASLDLKTTITPETAVIEASLEAEHKERLALSADIDNWQAPVREVTLRRFSLISDRLPPLTIREPGRLTIYSDHIDVKTLQIASGDASVELKGCAGLGPPYNLAVTLVLHGFDLERISGFAKGLEQVNIPAISASEHQGYDLRGAVSGRVHISGSIGDPVFTGRIGLKHGSLNLNKQGLSYETLSADLRLEPGVIYISDMLIEGDKEGRLRLSGSVTCNGFTPKAFALRAAGDNLYIPFHAGVNARIKPNLTLSGDWSAPKLTGDITITKGRVDLDRFYENRPSEIEIVQPVTHKNGVIQVPEEEPEPLPFVDPMAADIRVVILKNVWLKDRDESIEIKGDVNLKKEPHRSFILFGPLYSVRGTYRFHGKVFNITRGELNFIGQEEINPLLDIDAETMIGGVKIITHLAGTFEKFNIALDSEPAMEQVDIISYLIFGRPQDSLSEGESFSAAGAALSMTGQIAADELRDMLGDKFRVDYINISAGSGDIRQGSVAMGKYVTPKVFVIYRQGFTKDSPRQVEVDYEINKHFNLQTQVDEEKTSAVDLIWKHEF